MKILATISRILVGSLFIVSGLIKANDTLGFSYKLEEYFENGALAFRVRNMLGWDSFSLEFLMEHALLLAIIMCALEIILGFALLFGTRIKITVASLLSLTVVFFFLTLHTATCDPTSEYNQNTTYDVGSVGFETMMQRVDEGNTIVLEQTDEGVTFQEKLPVQCVTDCGCFGDAMKGSLGRSLTPWESFNKDLILMILLIPVFLQRKKIKYNNLRQDAIILLPSLLFVIFYAWVFAWYFPIVFYLIGCGGYFALKPFVNSVYKQFLPIGFATIISVGFIYYTYSSLPVRDYRPYAVGKSIPEQMTLPEGAEPDVYENIFYYKNKTTNEVEEFNENNYPWDDDNYEFHDRETKLIKAGDKPAITDFTMIGEDGNDYATDYLAEPYLFVLVSYDISKTNSDAYKKINTFVDQCYAEGNYIVGLSASPQSDIAEFKQKHNVNVDFMSCDGITLKTIVRANPGILLLKKGEILGKWNANQLPHYKEVKETYLK